MEQLAQRRAHLGQLGHDGSRIEGRVAEPRALVVACGLVVDDLHAQAARHEAREAQGARRDLHAPRRADAEARGPALRALGPQRLAVDSHQDVRAAIGDGVGQRDELLAGRAEAILDHEQAQRIVGGVASARTS